MKNISQIKNDISEIENISHKELKSMKPVEVRRMYKRLDLLRVMEKYLETSPTPQFVDQEVGRLEAIISAKMLEFQKVSEEKKYKTKLAKKEVSKLKKKHEDMYDLPKYRIQIKALRFLAA